MRSIKIENRSIGVDFEPYVIAELSANHNGSLSRAKEIIQMAKRSGADAVSGRKDAGGVDRDLRIGSRPY